MTREDFIAALYVFVLCCGCSHEAADKVKECSDPRGTYVWTAREVSGTCGDFEMTVTIGENGAHTVTQTEDCRGAFVRATVNSCTVSGQRTCVTRDANGKRLAEGTLSGSFLEMDGADYIEGPGTLEILAGDGTLICRSNYILTWRRP